MPIHQPLTKLNSADHSPCSAKPARGVSASIHPLVRVQQLIGNRALGSRLPLQSWVTSGSGQPLPESVREFFEPRFGYDFSNVHVHTGVQSTASAQQLGGVSDFRGDISYTCLGESSEEKLPKFKATVSFSRSRLDWWNNNSPGLGGVQTTLQAGSVFGGVHVMSGAADIPESRAAQIDKPETVQKNTAVLFVTGALF